jgi:hypothetical protein
MEERLPEYAEVVLIIKWVEDEIQVSHLEVDGKLLPAFSLDWRLQRNDPGFLDIRLMENRFTVRLLADEAEE